jgi:hypothetical protein
MNEIIMAIDLIFLHGAVLYLLYRERKRNGITAP